MDIEFPEPELSDESFLEELERPPAFQFYASNWISSTSLMDAEQRGWYIQLLAWAWGNSPVQGCLPDDEDELYLIAGNKLLSTPSIRKHALADVELDVQIKDNEKKWKRVREKFVPSPEHPGFVHNPRLTKVLKRQEMYKGIRKNRAKAGAEEKWRLWREQNPDKVNAANNPPSTTSTSKHNPSKARVERKHNQAYAKPLLESAPLSLPLNSSLSPLNNDDKTHLLPSEKRDKKVETEFIPEKFQITNQMRDWFKSKHPDLTEVDYQFIRDSFCDARETYGARAKDWWASFRTYVRGFMLDPDRISSMYNNRNGKAILQNGANRNGNRYESAIAERERLAREEDEHLQRLRSGSHGDSTEGSKSLQLPPFTSNTKR